MTQRRQLAAIMFTDIVGYTALMNQDEELAFELLRKNRKIQKPIIEKFNGRWLKEIGDGVLSSFDTASEAVYCANAIILKCKKEGNLNLRIGIHLGEVVFEGDDVFGDGVNIASRPESLAPVNSILVSESVHKNIANKKGLESNFIGEKSLKNVQDSVRVYEVNVDQDETGSIVSQDHKSAERSSQKRKFITYVSIVSIAFLTVMYFLYFNQQGSFSEKTDASELSIAVLPFKNFSGDPDLEPFCDGMTDAVISRLSKIEDIARVVSRTSIMAYKESPKTAPEIAADLDVTHILEANFQKAGDQVKVTPKDCIPCWN